MTPRVTSGMLIGALRRRAEADGGSATILSRGDEISGAVIIAWADKGETRATFERGLGPDDRYVWREAGPEAGSDWPHFAQYLEKRRRFDPDIWVVEIDGLGDPQWLDGLTGID